MNFSNVPTTTATIMVDDASETRGRTDSIGSNSSSDSLVSVPLTDADTTSVTDKMSAMWQEFKGNADSIAQQVNDYNTAGELAKVFTKKHMSAFRMITKAAYLGEQNTTQRLIQNGVSVPLLATVELEAVTKTIAGTATKATAAFIGALVGGVVSALEALIGKVADLMKTPFAKIATYDLTGGLKTLTGGLFFLAGASSGTHKFVSLEKIIDSKDSIGTKTIKVITHAATYAISVVGLLFAIVLAVAGAGLALGAGGVALGVGVVAGTIYGLGYAICAAFKGMQAFYNMSWTQRLEFLKGLMNSFIAAVKAAGAKVVELFNKFIAKIKNTSSGIDLKQILKDIKAWFSELKFDMPTMKKFVVGFFGGLLKLGKFVLTLPAYIAASIWNFLGMLYNGIKLILPTTWQAWIPKFPSINFKDLNWKHGLAVTAAIVAITGITVLTSGINWGFPAAVWIWKTVLIPAATWVGKNPYVIAGAAAVAAYIARVEYGFYKLNKQSKEQNATIESLSRDNSAKLDTIASILSGDRPSAVAAREKLLANGVKAESLFQYEPRRRISGTFAQLHKDFAPVAPLATDAVTIVDDESKKKK